MKKYDRISTYFKENWKVVWLMSITALCFDGLMCFIPQIEGNTINSLNDGDYQKTLILTISFICLVLFVQINRFFKRYLVRVFGNKMALKMRQISFTHLLNNDISYFSGNNTGDILNRNLSDIYDTTEGIRKMTTEFFDTFVLLIGYVTMMFIMDWKVTLYSMIFIILSIASAQFMKYFVYKSTKEYKEYLSIQKQLTISKLNNELNYRGFGVSDNYYADYEKSVGILRKKNMKALMYQSSLEPLYLGVAYIGIFFIAYFGGKNVINGVYEIGTLSAYLTTFLLVARKAAKVGKLFNAYQNFKVSWARCKGYMKDDEKEIRTDEINDCKLILKDFTYGYSTGFTLPKISLSCQQGDRIAICGRVHTGKSTILKALTGLYPYEGSATLSGIELINVNKNREQKITYCATDVSMFSDTVASNISLGRKGDLQKAIEVSKLDVDLQEIGGLDAQMSHSNSNISGGQQKRVQMARALYPKTLLVLLDDPFQSVNKELASQMVERLKEYQDEIIFFVSNNPDVIKNSTKVIYLDKQEVFIDEYAKLMENPSFKSLMEVK